MAAARAIARSISSPKLAKRPRCSSPPGWVPSGTQPTDVVDVISDAEGDVEQGGDTFGEVFSPPRTGPLVMQVPGHEVHIAADLKTGLDLLDSGSRFSVQRQVKRYKPRLLGLPINRPLPLKPDVILLELKIESFGALARLQRRPSNFRSAYLKVVEI